MLTSSRPNTVITDSDFEDNHGGRQLWLWRCGIYQSNLTTRNNLFHRNVAESLGSERSQGGAIFATALLLSQNDLFSENTASIGESAIRTTLKPILKRGFQANHATTMGAAIMLNSVGGNGFSGIQIACSLPTRVATARPLAPAHLFNKVDTGRVQLQSVNRIRAALAGLRIQFQLRHVKFAQGGAKGLDDFPLHPGQELGEIGEIPTLQLVGNFIVQLGHLPFLPASFR